MFGFPFDHLAALATFAFVASFTPGPNNVMLLASGVNYGFRRTVPHMAGIVFGFPLLLTSIGLGLGALFQAYPPLGEALKWFGVAYMLYLAWRIANAGAPASEAGGAGQPLTLFEAAAFQWVNPKGWIMGISAVATYSIADRYFASVALIALTFGLIAAGVTSTWAFFGVTLRRVLRDDRWRRIFNVAMALLLVATLVPIVFGAI
ncbi:MAG: LysE family translocator [Hyphomicrobiaceae bacterium]